MSFSSCFVIVRPRLAAPLVILVATLSVVLLAGGCDQMPSLSNVAVHDHEHEHGEDAHSHEHDHADEDHDHDHADDDHGHDHAGEEADHDHDHDHDSMLELSSQAKQNLGLSYVEVKRQPYEQTVAIPGIIVERPGLSRIDVSAPLTGIVTRVYCTKGETVTAGEPLFELRLTHEELVQAQREFLGTLEQIDVVEREVTRLEEVTRSGAVAGKTYLERQYELQKLEASLRTLREALMLHGLSEAQIDQIVATHTLFKDLTVYVPPGDAETSPDAPEALLQLKELSAVVGQHVEAGDRLCVLSNYRKLYIEGRAFEKDSQLLESLIDRGWDVCAACDAAGDSKDRVENLPLLYVAGEVDPQTRALNFYVELPNEARRDMSDSDGRRFVTWRFRPGQRCQLLVPIERWEDELVVPVEAVVEDGPESYVFVDHDGHFDRRPVVVKYRDQFSVVLGSDSDVKIGESVAASGAHQMNLAIKNQSGGAIDPHAGHNH